MHNSIALFFTSISFFLNVKWYIFAILCYYGLFGTVLVMGLLLKCSSLYKFAPYMSYVHFCCLIKQKCLKNTFLKFDLKHDMTESVSLATWLTMGRICKKSDKYWEKESELKDRI